MKKYLLLMAMAAMYFTACVPAKQYNDLKRKSDACDADMSRLSAENLAYNTKNKELELQIDQVNGDIAVIKSDMESKTNEMKKLQADYDALTENYNRTMTDSNTKLKTKDDEAKKALGKLQLTQQELFKMQDELNAKKKSLDEATAALQAREARVAELQKILNEKDSTASALRKKVTDALIGFNNNGLTIQQRNGKVYVSMEEKLLFASGSTDVDKKGVEALKQLAKVLEENKDINVMVEGHTDNVPIAGGPIKDNWDLSVLRATSVTKILLSSAKINSTRIIPSGRGDYVPVAKNDSAENKRKNRRIEVILTPKLDEILKVLEN